MRNASKDPHRSSTRSLVIAMSLVLAMALAVSSLSFASTTASTDEAPTYSSDVAAILHEHCASCHRPGEIAPMSLLTYDQTRPWAKSIRANVQAGVMPPWHADSSKKAYSNDRSLSANEIKTIVDWVNGGAKSGDLAAAPAPPQFEQGWRLGEPDLVFRAKKKFVVPVTDDEIPYQSITFHVEVPEDLYVRSWEIRPSDLRVVHHANLVRSPSSLDGQSVGIAGAVMKGGDYIGSYLPGHNAVEYPASMAYKLPKGSHLGIQVHYVSVGEEVEDELLFGVHLAEGRVDQLVRVVGTDYRALEIPPNESHYEIIDEIDLLFDMYALSSGAHMHLRGSAYTMEVVKPDGAVELVTEVPNYDFNWQSNYKLQDPVFMPKGSKLRVTSVWDNSANNPYNPDPSATVRYGPWTEDEMINSWSHVVLADEKLGLKLKNGRVVGHFDDRNTEFKSPFLIQSLPQAKGFQSNADKIKAHEEDEGDEGDE